MTDLESPEALTQRLVSSCYDGNWETFEIEKAAALIRADREARDRQWAKAFEALSDKLETRARAAIQNARDDRAGGLRGAASSIRETIATLLPPHQPPKSEPGDGEAGEMKPNGGEGG